MSDHVRHLDLEWQARGWPTERIDPDSIHRPEDRDEAALDADVQAQVYHDVRELLEVFVAQEHTRFTGSYVLDVFRSMAMLQPIGPLTGEDFEWGEPIDADGRYVQNRRCAQVFKDLDTGEAYDIRGRVFREPDGKTFTSQDSHTPVSFPYMPRSEVVDVPA